jgi:MFS family permease
MDSSRVKRISPTVIALGFVSLFTDFSSEMIYPLLPVFLSTVIGAGAFTLGVIEGVAEMTASVLKIISGHLTDRMGRRKPFVFVGYGLSSLMRPLIGLANVWPLVLFLRFMDRVGKGLRTSPRDALIADVTDVKVRGRAYGFHRAMDHAGAVIGPLVAVFLMEIAGFSLRGVFLFAAVPAVLVIIIVTFFVKEKQSGGDRGVTKSRDLSAHVSAQHGKTFLKDKNMKRNFNLFLFAVVIFSLGNSTDAFLLLRLSDAGVGISNIALLWSLFHVMKVLSTYAGGRFSDSIGRKPMIVTGWIYYSAVYLLFAFLEGGTLLIGVFLLYGIYFGLTEPVEKAWVSSLVPRELRGRAFGYYHGAVGIASLPASLIFGFIWQRWGYEFAFMAGGILALLGCVLITFVNESHDNESMGKEDFLSNPKTFNIKG